MSRLGIVDDINVRVYGHDDVNGILQRVVGSELKINVQVGLFGDARSIVESGNETLAIGPRDQGQVNVGIRANFTSLGNDRVGQFTRVLSNAKRWDS